MTRSAQWLAIAYVALVPVGRSDLPLNAQWGDLLFPILAAFVLLQTPVQSWVRRGDWPLALYLLITLTMAVVSPDPTAGLKHLVKQMYAALVFLVFRQMASDVALTHRLHKALLVSVASIIALAILLLQVRISGLPPLAVIHNLPIFGIVQRLRGGYDAPELLGDLLVVAFVVALWLRVVSHGRGRFWWTALATLVAAGEFLTYSHSLAGFCVAAVLFSAGSLSPRVRHFAWAAAISVVITVNAASVLDPNLADRPNNYSVGSLSFDFLGRRVEGGLIHYAALKHVAWSSFVAHPLSGVGPGRFTVETERAFKEGRLTARYRDKRPQSDVMGRLAETGIFGFVSLILLWASWTTTVRSALASSSSARRAAACAVVGLLVNSLNADVMNFRFLWIALAWANPTRNVSNDFPSREIRHREDTSPWATKWT